VLALIFATTVLPLIGSTNPPAAVPLELEEEPELLLEELELLPEDPDELVELVVGVPSNVDPLSPPFPHPDNPSDKPSAKSAGKSVFIVVRLFIDIMFPSQSFRSKAVGLAL